MLVFAGVVKKCLQHGHSFRLAGVWLKSENVRFACAVTRFCSWRVKKKTLEIYDFQSSESYQGDIWRHSLFQFFPLLDASGARALVAMQKPQSATRQRCDAMSSCRPKCTFLCTRFVFFCGASTEVAIFSSVSMFHPLVGYQQQWLYRFIPQTTSKMISLSLSKDILFVVDLGQLEPFAGIIFDTTDSMCNFCIFRNVKGVLVRDVNTPPQPPTPTPPNDHTTACATC